MVRTISRTTEIDAPPERVWQELARLEVEIEPLGDGRSRFTQAERFSGLLVRPFGGTLEKTERGFEAMNRALKERAKAA